MGTQGPCAGGIEGEGDVDLAVGKQLAHRRLVLREGPALAPHVRVQGVEIGKERRDIRLEGRRIDRTGQFVGIGDGGREHLLQEGRAVKVRRLGIGEAARVFGEIGGKGVERRGRVGDRDWCGFLLHERLQ